VFCRASLAQSAFAAVFLELLVIATLAGVVVARLLIDIRTPDTRYRALASVPVRPHALQELYASGILNRRAP
jgi:hypothetical protein